MKTSEFLKNLEKSTNPLFSFSDIAKIIGKDENYVKVFLDRLIRRKLLVRIERGKYALPNQNPFSIASTIAFPSYVSFISAYSFYSLTTQLPTTIFVVSLKQKREISNTYKIKFVTLAKKRFFGYRKEFLGGKVLFVAEIEKSVLDSLFLPQYSPVTETFFALKEATIDQEKLLSYVKKFDSGVVAKRLGYLLGLVGFDLHNGLKKFLSKNYELLNPLKPSSKERNKKWKLIINEVLE